MENRKKWTAVLTALVLLLLCAACTRGDPQEAVKDMRIEKSLAADGSLLCVIADQEGLEALGDIFFAEYEMGDMIDLPEGVQSLYFYTVYQTETQKLGQAAADLDMEKLLRYTVYEDENCLTMEVLLPDAASNVPYIDGLEDIMTFTCRISPEEAAFLRDCGNSGT